MTALLLALLACSSPPPPADVPRAEPAAALPEAAAYAFAREPEGAALALPATTRPDGAPAPEAFHPVAPFRRAGGTEGFTVWSTPLPVDFHLFLQREAGARTFGFYEPSGLEVGLGGEPLRFVRGARGPGTWGYDQERLFVGVPADAGAPDPAAVTLSWAKATAEERRLHLDTSGLSPEAFALRTVLLGTESFHGLLLPAPGSAAWRVTVPPSGVLSTRARILPPAIRAAEGSDGAVVRVEVEVGGERAVAAEVSVGDAWVDLRADLSAWAGREVTVRFLSDPAGTPTLDLLFLEDPTLYTPTDDPRRVVLAFIDTVRADHLGMYGYHRPTSPRLDAWAEGGVRFDDHRSVAPWTLPSTLAALSGRQPEDWSAGPTLAEVLGREGFATRGIVANAYLSQPFGIHRGFGHYTYTILQRAPVTVDQALADLEARWPDRDVLLLVQFMEAHLPYMEPPAYQGLFADPKPPGLKAVSRAELVKYDGDEPDFAEVRAHVVGRYDQNLRALDDQVGRLFEALGDRAVTVLFSDHGEEFWEHGGFEHGHTFYDEVLRVPMVVRGPGLPPGVVDVPTSLLDLTPTVLDLVGLTPDPDAPGVSLVPAARGDATARQHLLMRPQGFGRPLYGDDGWGVLKTRQKWIARDGRDLVYDLVDDPGEHHPTHGARAFPAELADALDREVVQAWRVQLRPRRHRGEVVLAVRHPGGVADAWSAYDPRGLHDDVRPEVVDGEARLVQPPGARMPPVIYVRPRAMATAAEGLEIELTAGDQVTRATATAPAASSTLLVPPTGPQRLTVDLVWVPVPGGEEVSAHHEDAEEALKALGYIDEDEPEAKAEVE